MPRLVPDTTAPPAAPDAPPSVAPKLVPTDESGRAIPPGWADWALGNAEAGGKLLGRTGVRVGMGLPNLLVGGSQAIGAGAEKLGVPLVQTPELGPLDTWLNKLGIPENAGNLYDNGQQLTGPGAPVRPLPSEGIINAAGLQIDPHAGRAMKVADFALPFVASGGRSALGRIGEAEGIANKTAEGVGYLTGAGLDAAGTYAGSELGDYIGGPFGAFLGSLVGGGVRPAVQRGFGYTGQKTIGSPEGGDVFDAMTNPQGPNTLPTMGQVSGDTGKRLEKALGSVPVFNWGINAARDAAEGGMARSVASGIGEVGDRSPSLAPVNPDVTGARIINAAQETNANLQAANAARQDALQSAIERGGGGTPNVSPLVAEVSKLINTTASPIARTLQPRLNDIYADINKTSPASPDGTQPYPPTLPYGFVKDLRSDLDVRSQAADPVPGHYMDVARQPYTDVMRTSAETAGQGAEFDAANAAYAKLKQIQQPWLEKQGGNISGETPVAPAPSTIVSRAAGITGPAPGYLADINTHLGAPVARNTLADVLSREGLKSGRFSPSEWGADYANVNEPTKAFIAEHAPEATPYLENAATGGRAFEIQPERPGLSKSIGWLGALAEAASKAPRSLMALGGGLETPSVIRALAGRTDIPALIAQYALRQGAAQR
jgi:hypothetical protein